MDARDMLYRQLLADYGDLVARLAAGFARSRAEREDLQQDIWFAVWRALPSFRGDAALKTYVLRIAHNRAMSLLARRREHAAGEVPEELADPSPLPDARLGRDEDAARLIAAVRRLPLALRQVVTLRLEGLAHAEIAAVLGISENNAAVRLNRALARLREIMQVERT